jgi:hypothetical protein
MSQLGSIQEQKEIKGNVLADERKYEEIGLEMQAEEEGHYYSLSYDNLMGI